MKDSGIKLLFSPTEKDKVTVSESYRFRKLPFLSGRRLPFSRVKVTIFCHKVTVFRDKVTVISESYRFGFS